MGKKRKNQGPTASLVHQAIDGSTDAVEQIVLQVRDKIFYLALRMLSHPEDAKDATQDILIKVISNLKTFRFEGPFQAWVYRIAANHLNTVRKSRMERFEISWEKAVQLVDQAEARGWLSNPPAAPSKMLEIEARLRCTQALLTAMDRPHRLAFILRVVMGVSSQEGAYILDISPAAFRKRVSRARDHLKTFLARHCGLFDDANRCSCAGVLANHLQNRWIRRDRPVFMKAASKTRTNAWLKDCLKELDELNRVAALLKAYPDSRHPQGISDRIKGIVSEKKFRVLADDSGFQE